MALATLDMVPFQMKLVTFLVLATMALSTGEEDSLESHMSSWEWTLAIFSVKSSIIPSDDPQVFGGCDCSYSYIQF